MKKWIAETLALVISLTALTPIEAAENTLPSHGHELITSVESSYKLGNYDGFFSDLHKQFESAGKAGAGLPGPPASKGAAAPC